MEELGLVIFVILIYSIPGAITAIIAHYKGRSKLGWFFIGALTGLIGIVLVAVLPSPKVQKEREQYAERENRRLREQLRQERMKGEAFRQHTQTRLDAHDETLGMDTRSLNTTALPGASQAPGGLLESQAGGPTDATTAQWYYELNGESVGPTSTEQIARLMRDGHLHAGTLVWAEHLGDWTAASNVPDFTPHLDQDRLI